MSRQQRYWQRRAELEQRSAQLRGRLVGHTRSMLPLFQVAERAQQTALWMRQHPWVPALFLGFILWRRPRRVFGWLSTGWAGWRWYTRLRTAWRGLP